MFHPYNFLRFICVTAKDNTTYRHHFTEAMRLPWLGDVGSYVFLCLISLAIFDVKTVVRVRIKNYNKVFKMPYCAIKWCGKSSKTSSLSKDGITFHRFPKCPKIKLKWMEATKREDNWFPGRNNFICSQHFTGDSFRHGNRRILLANAVPTQMLPTLTSQYPEALNSSTSETKDKESYALTTAIQPCSDIYIANIHKQTMDKLELVSSNKSFGGHQKVYSHESSELQCKINFSIYLPPQAEGGDVKLPVIFYLSGLTCNEQNFIGKSGFQRVAAEHGIIVVGPDTSPRGVKIPGDDESWDFGVAAGFYLDATKEPWSKNYRMGSYVNKELYDLILSAFNNIVDPDRIGIMGHSMGGHGALVSTLRNPGLYKSVSAFAPICNPSSCPWGVKAFTGYLGDDRKQWSEWDATELVKGYDGPPLTLFIDQGTEDKFYKEKQLLPENLVEACRSVGVPIIFNLRDGYDHSYYYISTYIKEHFDFHAKILKA